MLIDKSYFYGPLALAQLSQADNLILLNRYIQLYEPKILKAVLGYELYKALQAGLLVDPVASRWTNLLYGAEYTKPNGRLDFWPGIITYTDGLTIGTYTPVDRFYTVDGPGANDPVSGQNQLRDPFLKNLGASYRVVERGTGPIQVTTVDDPGGFDKAVNFTPGGVYTIEFIKPIPLPAPAVVVPSESVKSLIAQYVYFMYMDGQTIAVTGAGKKALVAQNAQATNDIAKEVSAWNEMVHMNRQLREFLNVNRVVYPEWKDTWLDSEDWLVNKFYKFKSSIG